MYYKTEGKRLYKLVTELGPIFYFDTPDDFVQFSERLSNIPWQGWSRKVDGEWSMKFIQGGNNEKGFNHFVLELATNKFVGVN